MVDPHPDLNNMPEPYWDPCLKSGKLKYLSLVRKLHQIGYFVYTTDPIEYAGLFFVWKSDRQKIRMIVDGRRANLRLRDPPGVDLLSAEGLSRFEVVPSFDEVGGDGPELYVGLSDVKDCFHRIRQPSWLARYFCLQPVEAHHVGLTGHCLEGRILRSNDLVYPAPGSLCMGCSWSLYFAQRINEKLMSEIPALMHSEPMSDKGEPVVFKSNGGRQVRHYTYVDNLGIVSTCEVAVRQGLAEIEDAFNSRGLLVHPGEIQHAQVKALGVCLNGTTLCTRLTPERFHRVRQGIRGLLLRRRVSGRTVEIILGHATFCALANRRLLSIFNAAYKFVRSSYSSPTPLWSSVRDEFRAFAALMPFLQSDWHRPWNQLVTCTDASEEGYGVCASWWPRSTVASVGRVSERSRFKRSGGHSARESALGSAGFIHDPTSGKWALPDIDINDFLDDSGWTLNADFAEVPAELLHKSQWEPKSWGRWQRAENILVLEARALIGGIRRVCSSNHGHDCRQLCLVDNLSLALCFERSRSRNFKVIRILRQASAYLLGFNISLSVRWIPSELNSADGPSRPGVGSSCDLTDVIPFPLGAARKPSDRTHEQRTWSSKRSEEACFVSSPAIGSSEQVKTPSSCFEPRRAATEQGAPFSVSPLTGFAEHARAPHQQTGRAPSCPSRHARAPNGTSEESERRGEQHHFGTTGGKGKAQAFGSTQPSPPSHLRGPALRVSNGSQPSLSPGAAGGDRKNSGVLREGVPGVPRLPEGSQLDQPPGLSRDGCRDDGLLQLPLPQGTPGSPWGQGSCFVCSPPPGLQPTRQPSTPGRSTCSERLASLGSGQLSQSLPFSSLGCPGAPARGDGPTSYGCLPAGVPVSVHTTERALSLSTLLFGPPDGPNQHRVVSSSESRGGRSPKQGGRIRRQLGPRQPLPQALGLKPLQDHETGTPRGATLGLILVLRLYPLLYEGSGSPVVARESLPAAPFRPVHRPQPQPTQLGGSPKAGPMEKSQVRGQVREIGAAGRHLRVVATQSPAVLSQRRKTSRGCDVWPGQLPKVRVRKRHPPGCYCLDLFSGVGGVARQCRALGYVCKEWDISWGKQFNLTDVAVQSRIKQDIAQGKVLAAMLAPPCSSFSRARDRTRVIRTTRFPWGLPSRFLSDAESASITLGNKCFRAAIDLIQCLDKHRVPWILENPSTSKCWWLPPLKTLLAAPHTHLRTVDFCQYGTPWQKRTCLLAGNLDFDDTARLARLCRGHGICSRTHQPHVQLTGCRHGRRMTQVAQPYPHQLNKALAYCLTQPTHYLYSQPFR